MAVWAGFRQAEVSYERQPRPAGRTRYRLRSMITLALDAVTSFSTVPLRMATWLGALVAPAGLALLAVAAARAAAGRDAGWEVPVALLALLNGVVLLLLGLLGDYVARMGDEARSRTLYVVREEAGAGAPGRPVRKRRGGAAGSSGSARRT